MKKKSLYLLIELISSFIIILIAYALFVYGNIKLGSESPIESTNNFSSVNSSNLEITPITPDKFLKMKDTFSNITVIDFWASKCLNCKKEIPLLRKYCKSKGYQVVYINAEHDFAGKKKIVEACMANFGISKSYIVANSDSSIQSNENLLKKFLVDIDITNYTGGSQFIVIYNPKKKARSSFNGFDVQTAFNKFMETQINAVKSLD